MKKIVISICQYPEDLERIQRILKERDYNATYEQCEQLWSAYSESMAAGWMGLPEDDEEVFEHISFYIKN